METWILLHSVHEGYTQCYTVTKIKFEIAMSISLVSWVYVRALNLWQPLVSPGRMIFRFHGHKWRAAEFSITKETDSGWLPALSLSDFFFFNLHSLSMANQVSRPSGTIQQLLWSFEAALDGLRLNLLKNIIFVLVLLNYWSKFYSKVAVGGPVRAAKDFQAYFKRVSSNCHFLVSICFVYLRQCNVSFSSSNCVASRPCRLKSMPSWTKHWLKWNVPWCLEKETMSSITLCFRRMATRMNRFWSFWKGMYTVQWWYICMSLVVNDVYLLTMIKFSRYASPRLGERQSLWNNLSRRPAIDQFVGRSVSPVCYLEPLASRSLPWRPKNGSGMRRHGTQHVQCSIDWMWYYDQRWHRKHHHGMQGVSWHVQGSQGNPVSWNVSLSCPLANLFYIAYLSIYVGLFPRQYMRLSWKRLDTSISSWSWCLSIQRRIRWTSSELLEPSLGIQSW